MKHFYFFLPLPKYILTIGWKRSKGILLEKRINQSNKWEILIRIGFKELSQRD